MTVRSDIPWQEQARRVADMDQRTAALGPKQERSLWYVGEVELSDEEWAEIIVRAAIALDKNR